MIYRLLFESTRSGKRIHPTLQIRPSRPPIKTPYGVLDGNRNIKSTPLLGTCQYIHEEATAVLYSDNFFHFWDLKNLAEYFPFYHVYNWLIHIGRRNRAKLRHLIFQITEDASIVYGHEYVTVGTSSRSHLSVAHTFGKALKLIAARHNLQTLELDFNYENASFSPYRKIWRKFAMIHGTEELRIKVKIPEEDNDETHKGFWELKEEMGATRLIMNGRAIYFDDLQSEAETAEEDTDHVATKLKSPTTFGFANDPIDQTAPKSSEL